MFPPKPLDYYKNLTAGGEISVNLQQAKAVRLPTNVFATGGFYGS
jgi:hypothetical protein